VAYRCLRELVLTAVRKRSRAGAAVVVVLHDLGLAAEVLPHPRTGTPLVLPRRLTDH